jgi:two-component system, OmpR family, response regulator
MSRSDRGLVLLAEDDPEQLEILGAVLECEGYRVLRADNPSRVLEQLIRGPDVVLLDLVGVASPAVMRVLGALPRRPGVMLVSGDDAARAGADAYISKPYDLSALLEELDGIMRRRRPKTHAHSAGLGWANVL